MIPVAAGLPPFVAATAPAPGPDEVGDEPILIPVQGGRYFTLPLILGLVLGVIAVLGCGAATILPWMSIPQSSGDMLTGGTFTSNLFGQMAVESVGLGDEIMGRQPNAWRFWWFPLAFIPLILIVIFLPGRWLRGGVLLGILLIGSIAWFVLVGLIQDELATWTPLARLVDSPILFGSGPPGEPGLGLGAWVMAGVGAIVLIATAINLSRSAASTAVVIGPVLAVGVLGISHLNHWYLPRAADVGMKGEVSGPSVREGGLVPATSEAVAVLFLESHASHPILVIPAERPRREGDSPGPNGSGRQPSGSGTKKSSDDASPPGQWASAWGRPDLVLSIKPERKPSGGLGSVKDGPLIAFGEEDRRLGSVLRPGQTQKITVRFAPVWEGKLAARDSMAGTWSVCLLDAGGKTITSLTLSVQGATHPDDRRIAELADKLQGAITTAEKRAQRLLELVASGPEQPGATAPNAVASVARECRGLCESLRACQTCASEMTRLGAPPSEKDKNRLAKLAEKASPSVEPFVALLDALDQRRLPEAVAQLGKLQELAASGSELAVALRPFLPAIVVDRAQAILEEKQPQDAVALLMAVAEDGLDDSRRGPAASMLVSGAVALLRESQSGLVGPNGDMGTDKDRGSPMRGVPFPGKTPSADRSFDAVVCRVRAWTKDAVTNEELVYLDLCARKLAGRLSEEDVIAFGKMRPKGHGDEATCWLGMKSLAKPDPAAAARYFAYVRAKWPAGEYAALAQLGQAIADHAAAEDDVLARIPFERTLIDGREHRRDWAADVRRLLPSGLANRRGDLDWSDGITPVSKPEEVAPWLEGAKQTILWLRMGAAPISDKQVLELTKAAGDGQILMADAAAFEALTSLRCQEPEERWLRGQAVPVRQWGKTPLQYPFLGGIQGVQYDSRASRKLVPLKAAAAAGTAVEAFLQADEDWLVCVAKLYTKNRGAIIFLPDRIADTPDGRRFLKSLVEFSLDALRKNKTEASDAAPMPGRPRPLPGRGR
ncbi:MAG: hypothetical protein NTW96_26950 [Planctomycetia bacterium]|nr:hypothetical protein [Planctomycetia bacterium]